MTQCRNHSTAGLMVWLLKPEPPKTYELFQGTIRLVRLCIRFVNMLRFLLLAGFIVQSFAGISQHRSRQLAPRQASYTKYINGTVNDVDPVQLEITVNGRGCNDTSPLFYGWMFEDINVRRPTYVQGLD